MSQSGSKPTLTKIDVGVLLEALGACQVPAKQEHMQRVIDARTHLLETLYAIDPEGALELASAEGVTGII